MNSAERFTERKDSIARVAAYQAAKDGTIPFIESPGHGWAKVPVAWVEALDLIVSRYSPRTKDFVWLEEDCDLTAFALELQLSVHTFAPDFKLTYNSFTTTYVEDIEAYWQEQGVTW